VQTWTEVALPPGVRVSISFAAPHETVRGTMEVYDEEKIYRTMAIDKTRKIKFVVAAVKGPAGHADPNADAQEQASEKAGERESAKTGETGTPKTSERSSRITDRRASGKTNEPVPYKPVNPSTGTTGRTRP
jgi:hypothetical protein